MDSLWISLDYALGLDADSPAAWQMGLRAVLIYLAAIVLVRLGEKRFLGKYTALDVILGFMLGSILSRAINGSAGFFETLAAALVLVVLHWTFAWIAFHSDAFGTLVKGSTRVLIRDGEIKWDAMRSSHISRDDLLGALRANARIEDPEQVKVAYLERSGDISAIGRKSEPRVIEVQVKDGVQTVRIRIE
jgi:uncharacterized membrane protein YcaP (DUF421 family)